MVEQQNILNQQQQIPTMGKTGTTSTIPMATTIPMTTTMPMTTTTMPMTTTTTMPMSVYSYTVDHGYRSDPQWNNYLQSDQFRNYWAMKSSNPTGYRSTEAYMAHRGMKQRIKQMFWKAKNLGRANKTYRTVPQWTTYTQTPAYQNYVLIKQKNPTGYRSTPEYQNHLTFKNTLKGKGRLSRLFHFRSDKAYKKRPEWGQYVLSPQYLAYRNMKLANPSTYKTMPDYQTHLQMKNKFKLLK